MLANHLFSHSTLKQISFLLIAGIGLISPAYAESDIVDIPFEQLLETEVITAEKIAQQVSDAPSAVSIVTAQDIHDYGYLNLADILKSMRGLSIVSELGFNFLGGRGYGGADDLAGHVMILIDGNSVGDNFFNRVLLGNDSLIDVAMIDRVEYIPGPGSTSYGSGAFFGVINIITKKGGDLQGAQIATGFGNAGAKTSRISFGRQLDNGADILASASTLNGRNQPVYNLAFSESGVFETNKDTNSRLFIKAHYENWSLELAHAKSSNVQPTFFNGETYRTIFTDNDTGYIGLRYDTDIGKQLKSSTHAYYAQYRFNFAADAPVSTFNSFQATQTTLSPNRWWGIDQKFVGNWFDHHQIVFGASYRHDYQEKITFSVNTDNFDFSQTYDSTLETSSFFAQDEYQVLEHLKLNIGARYDETSKSDRHISPRLAAIWEVLPASTLKLSYGEAFRNQNEYDTFSSESSKRLPPEQVATTELVWQQKFGSNTSLIASLYQYKMTDAIQKPYQQADTNGQELELEHVWENGMRMRTSFSHQTVKDDSGKLRPYLPRNLAKLNLSIPMLNHRLNAGVEAQYISTAISTDIDGTIVPYGDYTVTNLTLSSASIVPNLDMRLTVRNLFQANDTSGPQTPTNNRSIWLQLEYAIK